MSEQAMNDQIIVVLDELALETFGANTLVGIVYTDNNYELPKEVVIQCPMTSYSWREKNGGPNQWVINEHVISCLLDDIVWLQEHSIKVSVTTTTKDPS